MKSIFHQYADLSRDVEEYLLARITKVVSFTTSAFAIDMLFVTFNN